MYLAAEHNFDGSWNKSLVHPLPAIAQTVDDDDQDEVNGDGDGESRAKAVDLLQECVKTSPAGSSSFPIRFLMFMMSCWQLIFSRRASFHGFDFFKAQGSFLVI